MYRDPCGTDGNECEKGYEGDISGYSGIVPLCREQNIYDGPSSSLSNHVYPNPLFLSIQTPDCVR